MRDALVHAVREVRDSDHDGWRGIYRFTAATGGGLVQVQNALAALVDEGIAERAWMYGPPVWREARS